MKKDFIISKIEASQDGLYKADPTISTH